MTIKTRLIIALAIGFFISTVFMAIPSMRDGTSDWSSLELPGMGAAFLFWGAVGDSVFAGTAIAYVVNAVVYGAFAFAALVVSRLLTLDLPD